MLLAHSFLWIVIGLFVLGVVGLVVTAIALLVRLLRFVFRAAADSGRKQPALARSKRLVCPEPRCGHANPADARYCARCGRPFQHDHDLDAYG